MRDYFKQKICRYRIEIFNKNSLIESGRYTRVRWEHNLQITWGVLASECRREMMDINAAKNIGDEICEIVWSLLFD